MLAIALRKKYEIKEISYCSFWNRYGLITRFEDFDKVDNEKLGKPYRGGKDVFSHEELNLEETLLQKLKQLHPTAFEKFSLELIKNVALARGGEVEIFHNGQVGDGGVDGIIEAPKTFGKGKEKVFVQCKRYDKTSIGRPELQAFAGAMLTEDITVGIFITTSTFSKQAINYVEELENKGKSIELFDGQRIIKHMLRNKIAVSEKITSSFEIDESYFDKFN